MIDLTIAVLSWRQPKTLKNTFESYRKNGLLDLVREKLVFFNEVSPEDIKIAKEYGFEVLSAKQNIGIGLPFQQLVERASSKYLLFLENDFMLIENAEVTEQRLKHAVSLLEEGMTAVRFRHRRHYGDPNNYLKLVWNGYFDPKNPHMDGTDYWEHPEEVYKGTCEKISCDGEDFYIMDSAYAAYTNNPTMYHTAFLKEHILPLKFNSIDVIENKVQEWWCGGGYKVARGAGLFKHHPIDLSGSAFSNFKRVKSPVKNPLHYLIRLGLRGRVFNCFIFQFLPMIFKVNLNIANRFMINFSLGRYESA